MAIGKNRPTKTRWFERKANLIKKSPDPVKPDPVTTAETKVDPIPAVPRWSTIIDGATLSVVAYSRSEARSKIKTILGLDRLPVGCEIERTDYQPPVPVAAETQA